MPTYTGSKISALGDQQVTITSVKGDEVTVPFPTEQDHTTLIATHQALNRALTELDGLGMAGICRALGKEFRDIWEDFFTHISHLGFSVSEERFGARVHKLQWDQSEDACRVLGSLHGVADAMSELARDIDKVAEQSPQILQATARARGEAAAAIPASEGPTPGGGFANGLGTV